MNGKIKLFLVFMSFVQLSIVASQECKRIYVVPFFMKDGKAQCVVRKIGHDDKVTLKALTAVVEASHKNDPEATLKVLLDLRFGTIKNKQLIGYAFDDVDAKSKDPVKAIAYGVQIAPPVLNTRCSHPSVVIPFQDLIVNHNRDECLTCLTTQNNGQNLLFNCLNAKISELEHMAQKSPLDENGFIRAGNEVVHRHAVARPSSVSFDSSKRDVSAAAAAAAAASVNPKEREVKTKTQDRRSSDSKSGAGWPGAMRDAPQDVNLPASAVPVAPARTALGLMREAHAHAAVAGAAGSSDKSADSKHVKSSGDCYSAAVAAAASTGSRSHGTHAQPVAKTSDRKSSSARTETRFTFAPVDVTDSQKRALDDKKSASKSADKATVNIYTLKNRNEILKFENDTKKLQKTNYNNLSSQDFKDHFSTCVTLFDRFLKFSETNDILKSSDQYFTAVGHYEKERKEYLSYCKLLNDRSNPVPRNFSSNIQNALAAMAEFIRVITNKFNQRMDSIR